MKHFKKFVFVAGAVAVSATGATLPSDAQAGAYDGKTVTVLIGRPAGSGADLTVRAFLKYWEKAIPGNPKLVGKQQTKGGGLGIYNLIAKEKPDGMTMIFTPYNPIPQILGDKKMRADFTKMGFVGGLTNPSLTYGSTTVIKNRNDVAGMKDAKLGGQRPHHRFDLLGRVSLDMAGAKYAYVTGFKGSKKVYNSLLRGEITLQTVGFNVYSAYAQPNLASKGKAIPLWYHPTTTADGSYRDLSSTFGDIPSFPDFFKAKTGKAPSGELYELYQWMAQTLNGMSYIAMLPPGTPENILNDLRTGFQKVVNDKAYLADQKKMFGFNLPSVDAKTGAFYIGMLGKVPPERLKQLNEYINEGKKSVMKKKKKS
ncbi:hypothetical protein ACFL17_03880 [Pseudomonadota bacterium]